MAYSKFEIPETPFEQKLKSTLRKLAYLLPMYAGTGYPMELIAKLYNQMGKLPGSIRKSKMAASCP